MQSFLIVISLLLLLIYIALIIIYRIYWSDIPSYIVKYGNKRFSTFISIIVPARNEECNIASLLESIKNQSYPQHLFEVIVVDDFSTDNTKHIVQSFDCTFIKYLSLEDHISESNINSYKKKALETGISLSKGELIVTTDADCVVKENWMATIADFYELHKPDMIVMPVVMDDVRTPIQMFQSLDFMSLQGITAAGLHYKMHGMCNGANLAYRKTSYKEVGGFSGIDHIASGDDMMLLHKFSARDKNSILYLKSKEVIVKTQPVNDVRSFINQRIRWASKADKYQDKSLLPILLIVYLFNCSLFLLFLGSLFFNKEASLLSYSFSIRELLLFSIVVKTAAEMIFLIPVSHFFNQRRLMWAFPIFQPFHVIYIIIAGWLGKFGEYSWKERKVK